MPSVWDQISKVPRIVSAIKGFLAATLTVVTAFISVLRDIPPEYWIPGSCLTFILAAFAIEKGADLLGHGVRSERRKKIENWRAMIARATKTWRLGDNVDHLLRSDGHYLSLRAYMRKDFPLRDALGMVEGSHLPVEILEATLLVEALEREWGLVEKRSKKSASNYLFT